MVHSYLIAHYYPKATSKPSYSSQEKTDFLDLNSIAKEFAQANVSSFFLDHIKIYMPIMTFKSFSVFTLILV